MHEYQKENQIHFNEVVLFYFYKYFILIYYTKLRVIEYFLFIL